MTPTDNKFDDEWTRVSQNPDNMIVSDVIKESIDKLIGSDAGEALAPPIVTLTGSIARLDMEMIKIKMSPAAWSVSCIAGIVDGHTLIRTDKKSWKSICVCTEPDGDDLMRLDIRADVIHIEVEFPPGAGICTVNLSYSNEREQTRVL